MPRILENMEISIKYGSGEVPLVIPPDADQLQHQEPEGNVNLDKFKRDIHSYLYSVNRMITS